MTDPHIKRHLNASYRSWHIRHDAEQARRRAAGEP
jgi:hypothetical protein